MKRASQMAKMIDIGRFCAYASLFLRGPTYDSYIKDVSTTSFKFLIRASNVTLKGNGRTLPVSENPIVSIGDDGSSEILNAHKSSAVVTNREL